MTSVLPFADIKEQATQICPDSDIVLGIIAAADPVELGNSISELYDTDISTFRKKQDAELAYAIARRNSTTDPDSLYALTAAAQLSLAADEKRREFIESQKADLNLAREVRERIQKLEKPMGQGVYLTLLVFSQLAMIASERLVEKAGLFDKGALSLSVIEKHDLTSGNFLIRLVGGVAVALYGTSLIMSRYRGLEAHRRAKKALKNDDKSS